MALASPSNALLELGFLGKRTIFSTCEDLRTPNQYLGHIFIFVNQKKVYFFFDIHQPWEQVTLTQEIDIGSVLKTLIVRVMTIDIRNNPWQAYDSSHYELRG